MSINPLGGVRTAFAPSDAPRVEDVIRSLGLHPASLQSLLDPSFAALLARLTGGVGAAAPAELPAFAPSFDIAAMVGGAHTGMLGMPGYFDELAQSFGGAGFTAQNPLGGQMLGGMEGIAQALGMLREVVGQQQQLEAQALGIAPINTNPPSFPSVGGSNFLDKLPGDPKGVAQALNVSGSRDVERINRAVTGLRIAKVDVTPAKEGDRTTAGKLVLSAEDAARIRNAPDAATAKQELAKIIARQTGVDVDAPNMGDKKSIKNKKYREAVNALLGTKVKNGVEKNSGSAMVFDAMLESTVRSLREGSFGSSDYASSQRLSTGSSVFEVPGGGTTVNQAPGSVTVNFDPFRIPTDSVRELGSPLIFDLTGQGLKVKNARFVSLDIDGDGRKEVITDVDRGIGLLVFDSRFQAEGGQDYGEGRDMFGDGSDLRAYGIVGPREDGSFDNGFEALRALCEHFDRVHGNKQHLDASDLAFLEQKCGLRMRTDGIKGEQDKRFSELGITRINLGSPDRIESIQRASEDAFGNKLMRQEGATFLVRGVQREYADIWFNVQARDTAQPMTMRAPAPMPGRRLSVVRV